MEHQRQEVPRRPVAERVKDYRRAELELGTEDLLRQAARCMDCGMPFCHGIGCPLQNRMPEFNDLAVPGRDLENVHFAMEYLTQQNRINAGEDLDDSRRIDAKGKVVVVIGGGDTGSDCVGTARRQGAEEVHQFEILPKPPEGANPQTPWPIWPRILRTSTSHEEGCSRRWCVLTKEFTGTGGRISQLRGCQVEWTRTGGKWQTAELAGSEFTMDVDLVLLAMGFTHVAHAGLVDNLGLELDASGNLAVDEDHQTSRPGVFAAGDAALGASLVVRAIAEGRNVAASIDRWLSAGRGRL